MHAWCRSTTVAWFDDQPLEGIERRARDPVTGKTYLVPADMYFDEWYDKKVRGNTEAEAVFKAVENKSGDQKQFERYKELLGDNVPKTFAEFQKMKYNDVKQYEDLKGFYSYIRRNPESDLKFYRINKVIQDQISTGIINDSVGVATKPIAATVDQISKHAEKQLIKRGINKENAQSYIDNAVVMFKQGEKQAYYSLNGAAVIITDDNRLVTAFPDTWFDSGAVKILEVVESVK